MKLVLELKKNNIKIIDLRGDYLFIDGNLAKDSMLIPLKYVKLEKKYKKEDEEVEPSFFEMLPSNQS